MDKIAKSDSQRKPWLRLYRESLNNPKIGMLTDRQHRVWHNCLLIADDGGELPSMGDMAFHLRITCEDAERTVSELIEVGLIDVVMTDGPRRLVMHDWSVHQYTSDTSIERVKRYRQKRKDAGLASLGDYSKFKPILIKRDGKQCVYCKSTEKLVVDHMVPIQLGGTDDTDNLAIACKRCNSGKAGRTPKQAGLNFAIKSAEHALLRYQSRDVTVTVTPPDTDTDTENNLTTVEQDAEREQKFDFKNLIGKGRRGVKPRLKARAEGLGLPADDLELRATAEHIENPSGMFRHLCVEHMKRMLPNAPPAVLKASLSDGNDAAFATVCQLLLEVTP